LPQKVPRPKHATTRVRSSSWEIKLPTKYFNTGTPRRARQLVALVAFLTVLVIGVLFADALLVVFLTASNVLDLELYNHVTEVRLACNRWIHQPDKTISMKEAHSSEKPAEKLLLRGRDIDLITQSLLTYSG
jgi:hypothetical protein